MNFLKKMFGVFKKEEWKLNIYAPVDGELVLAKDIPDETFSAGYLGEGIAIKPSQEKVYAPITGQLSVAFQTGHAFFIREKREKVAVLLHLGVDTVNIPVDKKAFQAYFSQDDYVKQGDLLVTMDLKVINELAPSDLALVFVQKENLEDKEVVFHKTQGSVQKGELLMSVIFKK